MRILFILFFFISCSLFSKDLYISDIKFSGLKNFSENSIFEKIGLQSKVGSKSLFEKLVNLEIFSRIKISVIKNTLYINVIEKPFIGSVTLNDENDSVLLSLLAEYKIKIGELYDFDVLEAFKVRCREIFFSKGYYNIDLDVSIAFYKKRNMVDLKINVQKNSLFRINKMELSGNKVYEETHLLTLLSQSKFSWLSWALGRNFYLKSKLISGLKRVKKIYVDAGYMDFHVNFVKLFLSKNKKKVCIFVDFYEGRRYKFGEIKIRNLPAAMSKSDLEDIINSCNITGNMFSYAKLLKARKKMREFLFENDISAFVNFVIVNSRVKGLNIVFNFSVLPEVIVRRIEFSENFFTSDDVLRRVIPQFENTRMSMRSVFIGKRELVRRGFAKKVKVFFYKRSDNRQDIDVVYKLKEISINKFMAGGSYVKGDPHVFLNVDIINFLGLGRDIMLHVNKGKYISDYNFTYINSKFSPHDYDISYGCYYRKHKLHKNVPHFDYASNVFGVVIMYTDKISEYEKVSAGFGFDKTRLKVSENRVPVEAKRFIHKEGTKYKEYFFSFSYIYNSLDKLMFPNDGCIQHLTIRVSLPGSDIKYYSLSYDANNYVKFFEDCIFNIYCNICYGNKHSGTKVYPFFKHFFLKGANNVRGYRDLTLGPRDSNNDFIGGNFLFCAKASFFFPIPVISDMRTARASVFFDFGQLYNTLKLSNRPLRVGKRFKYNSFLKYSSGFAISWNSPFGVPIDFFVAYPLNAAKTDRKKMFSFTVGTHHR